MSSPRGCYRHLASFVKKADNIPVISVGRINTPEVAQSIIADEDADMVAIGQGMLADPYWANKAKGGDIPNIRRCVACNGKGNLVAYWIIFFATWIDLIFQSNPAKRVRSRTFVNMNRMSSS